METSKWHKEACGQGRHYMLGNDPYIKYDDQDNIVARITEGLRNFIHSEPAVRISLFSPQGHNERAIIAIPYQSDQELILSNFAILIYQSLIGYYLNADPNSSHFGISNTILEGNMNSLLRREMEKLINQFQNRDDMAGRLLENIKLVGDKPIEEADPVYLSDTIKKGLDIHAGYRIVTKGINVNCSRIFVPVQTGKEIIDRVYQNIEQMMIHNFVSFDETGLKYLQLTESLIFKDLESVLKRAREKENTRKKILNNLQFNTILTEEFQIAHDSVAQDRLYDALNRIQDSRLQEYTEKSNVLYATHVLENKGIFPENLPLYRDQQEKPPQIETFTNEEKQNDLSAQFQKTEQRLKQNIAVEKSLSNEKGISSETETSHKESSSLKEQNKNDPSSALNQDNKNITEFSIDTVIQNGTEESQEKVGVDNSLTAESTGTTSDSNNTEAVTSKGISEKSSESIGQNNNQAPETTIKKSFQNDPAEKQISSKKDKDQPHIAAYVAKFNRTPESEQSEDPENVEKRFQVSTDKPSTEKAENTSKNELTGIQGKSENEESRKSKNISQTANQQRPISEEDDETVLNQNTKPTKGIQGSTVGTVVLTPEDLRKNKNRSNKPKEKTNIILTQKTVHDTLKKKDNINKPFKSQKTQQNVKNENHSYPPGQPSKSDVPPKPKKSIILPGKKTQLDVEGKTRKEVVRKENNGTKKEHTDQRPVTRKYVELASENDVKRVKERDMSFLQTGKQEPALGDGKQQQRRYADHPLKDIYSRNMEDENQMYDGVEDHEKNRKDINHPLDKDFLLYPYRSDLEKQHGTTTLDQKALHPKDYDFSRRVKARRTYVPHPFDLNPPTNWGRRHYDKGPQKVRFMSKLKANQEEPK